MAQRWTQPPGRNPGRCVQPLLLGRLRKRISDLSLCFLDIGFAYSKQNLMTQPRKCYDRSLILFPSRPRRSGCTPWLGLGPKAGFMVPRTNTKNWTSFNYYSPKHSATIRETFWQNQGFACSSSPSTDNGVAACHQAKHHHLQSLRGNRLFPHTGVRLEHSLAIYQVLRQSISPAHVHTQIHRRRSHIQGMQAHPWPTPRVYYRNGYQEGEWGAGGTKLSQGPELTYHHRYYNH